MTCPETGRWPLTTDQKPQTRSTTGQCRMRRAHAIEGGERGREREPSHQPTGPCPVGLPHTTTAALRNQSEVRNPGDQEGRLPSHLTRIYSIPAEGLTGRVVGFRGMCVAPLPCCSGDYKVNTSHGVTMSDTCMA